MCSKPFITLKNLEKLSKQAKSVGSASGIFWKKYFAPYGELKTERKD